jgi:hypothetical protein
MIEYSEYLVLSERDAKNFKGDYRSFCNFKEVLELAENISRKQIDTYLYMDEHYKLPITLVELNKAIDSVKTKKFGSNTKLLRKIALQIGIRKI